MYRRKLSVPEDADSALRYGAGLGDEKLRASATAVEQTANDGVVLVNANDMSQADQRLAEMGYVQVFIDARSVSLSPDTYIIAGIQTRILLALMYLLRHVHIWPLRYFALHLLPFLYSLLPASVATTYVYPLAAGGAASAVWCWLIAGFGCMTIAVSVAELVSAYPTSGGLYFTCKYVAPENWMAELSWLCGWLTVIGQIAGLASTEYGCAQLLVASISMGKS